VCTLFPLESISAVCVITGISTSTITSKQQQQHPFNGPLSGATQVSWYQKGLDLLEQERLSGSGISWAICKSAPRPRQITMPVSHHSVWTGRTPFLLPNQQRQSTEGNNSKQALAYVIG